MFDSYIYILMYIVVMRTGIKHHISLPPLYSLNAYGISIYTNTQFFIVTTNIHYKHII